MLRGAPFVSLRWSEAAPRARLCEPQCGGPVSPQHGSAVAGCRSLPLPPPRGGGWCAGGPAPSRGLSAVLSRISCGGTGNISSRRCGAGLCMGWVA